MASRRSGDVDNVRPSLPQKFRQVAEIILDGKSFVELTSHERLAIADADDLASLDSSYLGGVRVCDLPTSNDGNLNHARSDDNPPNRGRALPPLIPGAPTPFGISTF